MVEGWVCPNCNAWWQSHRGKCPQCYYGFSAEDRRLMQPHTAPPLVGPNGQGLPPAPVGPPVRDMTPVRSASTPAPEADRYQALLAAVQQMLQPVVQWLHAHGVQVTQLTEAIPAMLAQVEAREQFYQQNRAQAASVAPEWQTRIEHVEHGLQQIALAVATLRQPPAPPLVPEAPDQPYSSFLIEDREQAQLEQALLQQQRTRPQPWE